MDTQRIYDAAWMWLINYGPKIVIAIVILIAGEWLIKILRRRLRKNLERRKVERGILPFIQSFVIAGLHILLFLMVIQTAGIRLTMFAAILAAFGAAAGFALSGTLQNFASGILILLLKPFKIGDKIIAQGQEGTISSIQLFYTFLITYDNRTVILPNSKLSNDVITNISMEGRRRFEVELKLPYNVEANTVRNAILGSISTDKNIIHEPKPEVAVSGFDPDGYRIQVHAWLNTNGFYSKHFSLNELILSALISAGIKKT
jgi:small conductance mechanosensitive channel